MKSVYFTYGTPSEQRLYEDLIIESLKIYGLDVYYLPREIVKLDELFGEDILSKFDENYTIEMYMANFDGFQGDGTLFTKFGVRISDEATFIVSKRRWEDLVSSSNNLVSSFRPNEGDLIYYPLTKSLFQIKFVEHELPFRQLGAVQTYQLRCELMEYSDERIETGVDELDDIMLDNSSSVTYTLEAGGTGTYELKEKVYVQGKPEIYGYVSEWNKPTRELELINRTGNFEEDMVLIGETSGATWTIYNFSALDNSNEGYDENKYYEDQGDLIIDWSDGNPFGEYGNMGGGF